MDFPLFGRSSRKQSPDCTDARFLRRINSTIRLHTRALFKGSLVTNEVGRDMEINEKTTKDEINNMYTYIRK